MLKLCGIEKKSESFSHWVTLEAWICLTSWLNKSPKWRFMVMFHDYIYKDWEKHKKKPIVVIESWYLSFGGSTFQFRKKRKNTGWKKGSKTAPPRFAAVNFGPCYEKNNAKLLPCKLHIFPSQGVESFIHFIHSMLPSEVYDVCLLLLNDLKWLLFKRQVPDTKMVAAMEIYIQGFLPYRTMKTYKNFFSTWMFPKIVGFPQIIHFNRVFHYKPSILGYP